MSAQTVNQHQLDLYPSLTPLLVLHDAFLDGALDGIDFLYSLYGELEDGDLKPSFLFRTFKGTLGSMSNHSDEFVAFMAKDLLRELPLRSSLPFNDLASQYWENGYTGETEELLMKVEADRPAVVEGWNSYVITRKPYGDDAELNEDFVLANLNSESILEVDDLFEDRGYEPAGFRPDVELTNDWLTPMFAFRRDYFSRLHALRNELEKHSSFLSNKWIFYGNQDVLYLVSDFFRANAREIGQLLNGLANLDAINELAQALFSIEALEAPIRLIGTKSAPKGGIALDVTKAHIDEMLKALKNHTDETVWFRAENFAEQWEDEILDKLTSSGSLMHSDTSYERIEEMAQFCLDQILSTYPERADAKDSRLWNEGYIRAVIEDGVPDAHSKAWEFYRHHLSTAGAVAFDTAETVSEGWKLFNIVSRSAGDVHDIILAFEDDGVIIAPEYNPTYQKKISWALARFKLGKNEFVPSATAFGKSNDIARALALMIPSPAKPA